MEEAASLVSVIMPCFNAGPMLAPALVSVIRQTWPNLEIIFVDNNSTDGSGEVARGLAKVAARPFTIVQCPEQGQNHARNFGYGLARGEFIQWMDADDDMDPDKIARQVAALGKEPVADIAYGDWTANFIGKDRPPSARRQRLAQVEDQVRRTLAGVWYPPHLYLLRRAAAQRLQDLRAWRPERVVATDLEYFALAALIGMRFRHVEDAHVRYNVWSEGQVSGSTPYLVRVAGLKAIFSDLQAFVGSGQAKVPLNRAHKVLLGQNWDVWRLPRDSVALTRAAGRRFALRHEASGRVIDLRPREAAVVRALLAAPRPQVSCHLALMLAETVPEIAGDHAAAVEIIERLGKEGFLERVEDEEASAFQ
ncbi:MAG: glycosyltransferase family 2 protein [Caulobacteraceae bacterium]